MTNRIIAHIRNAIDRFYAAYLIFWGIEVPPDELDDNTEAIARFDAVVAEINRRIR